MKLATIADLDRAYAFACGLLNKGPIEWACKRWVKTRTEPQNNYLFGVCYPPIGEAMGYAVGDLHEWVCGTFFGWVDKKCPKTPRNPEGWESVPFRTTTKDENGKRDVIDPQRFGQLLETVVFPAAAKAGAFIPEPYKEAA